MGVMLLEEKLAMYAVLASGVMAIACGSKPAGIGVPAVLPATAIGVTLFETRFVT